MSRTSIGDNRRPIRWSLTSPKLHLATYKILIKISLPLVLMYQKCEVSLPMGTKQQNLKQEAGNDYDVISGLGKQISRKLSYFLINNALLYHFLANWLAHSNKMTEKSVFRKASSPEMTSPSCPVSGFGHPRLCSE